MAANSPLHACTILTNTKMTQKEDLESQIAFAEGARKLAKERAKSFQEISKALKSRIAELKSQLHDLESETKTLNS
jgi:chromosome segregation ATPase